LGDMIQDLFYFAEGGFSLPITSSATDYLSRVR